MNVTHYPHTSDSDLDVPMRKNLIESWRPRETRTAEPLQLRKGRRRRARSTKHGIAAASLEVTVSDSSIRRTVTRRSSLLVLLPPGRPRGKDDDGKGNLLQNFRRAVLVSILHRKSCRFWLVQLSGNSVGSITWSTSWQPLAAPSRRKK